MNTRAVLFDLDGTLVHSAPDLAAAANRMRAAFGLPPLAVERVADFIGKGIPMLVRRALVDDLAGAADESLVPRALAVTNKSARFTDDLLRQLDLLSPFGVVVSGDTLAARKPDPAPLHHAFERLGVRSAEALMLGDSANDVAAARAAGCAVWCVSYGYREGAPVASLGADRIVASVHEAALALSAGAA